MLTFSKSGGHVTVHAPQAEAIEVCVFVNGRESRSELIKSGGIHEGDVAGLLPGAKYGFRASGPWQPANGLRFDSAKLLVDPQAVQLDGPFRSDPRLSLFGADTAEIVPKAIAVAPAPDIRPQPLRAPDFVYEIPVKAFTNRHPDVPENQRGTIAALAHPSVIAHFKKIGADTLELMPITAWIDEGHLAALGLHNAWGYNPVCLMAPDPRLAPGGLDEIRQTLATLHAEGFNVILDMVLNHSGESDTLGPTLSFRGLDNTGYYAHHDSVLANDTGCGNTLALDHPPALYLALAALRHWVLQAGFDGFRFDLATVMGRRPSGFDPAAPLLRAIDADPVLASRIMIAEPWDVGLGGYQLGNFPPRWLEWNDRFRDDVRRFWRGDDFSANAFATRMAGSSEIFGKTAASTRSVNFIAAHDGFTLRDLTIYNHKNNLANGEDNRDGKNDEVTVPQGNVRALLASLFLSRGTVLLTAGDEFGRTQRGNNNAYAQDNELTWLDWSHADRDLIDFVASVVKLRRDLPVEKTFLELSQARWLDQNGESFDWYGARGRFIALLVKSHYCIAINGGDTAIHFDAETHLGKDWILRFGADSMPNCPAKSVIVFAPQAEPQKR